MLKGSLTALSFQAMVSQAEVSRLEAEDAIAKARALAQYSAARFSKHEQGESKMIMPNTNACMSVA